MVKKTIEVAFEKLGTHLTKVTNNVTGATILMWDWDALLKEVQEATGNIVAVTEAKLKKTRKKKEV